MEMQEIMNRIIALCQEHHANTAYLFGSRAKGTARERSDIDIAVTGVADAEELREAFAQIPTLYKIDLVDMDTCGNELLMEDIREYGCKIYEAV